MRIMTKKITNEKGANTPNDEETPLANRPEQSWLTQDFDNIFDQVRRSFEDLMTPIFNWPSSFPQLETMRNLSIDLEDNGDHFRATVQLPGYGKDQVEVKVNEDTLEIHAERRTKDGQKNGDSIHREQSYSAFQRTITLPEEVTPSKTESSMKNGILVITLPKKHPASKKSLQKVQVRG